MKNIRLSFDSDKRMPFALHDSDMSYYRQYLVVGGMAENYVCLSLIASRYHYYYWQSDRGAEVDFLIQRKGRIIPIEVKSADNTRAKSLTEYIKSNKPDYAIKLSTKYFGFKDGKKTVPLYAAFCI